MNAPRMPRSLQHSARIIGLAVLTTTCVVAVAAALVYGREMFLILFLGVLFAVFLVHTGDRLSSGLPLGYSLSLALIVTLLIIAGVGSVAVFGVQFNHQIEQAKKHLDDSQQKLIEFADQYPAVRSTIESTPFVRELLHREGTNRSSHGRESNSGRAAKLSSEQSPNHSSSNSKQQDSSPSAESGERQAVGSVASMAAKAIAQIFQTTFGLVVNSVLIVFVGLFLAISPDSYRDGVVVLFPPQRRERTREVMNMLGDTLWRWLLGRFGSMLITGVGAATLLGLLGVPMGITLGVVTGLLTFIPNIGGVIAFLLAMLFALPQGGGTVLAVLIGYMVLQVIESYVVTPLIQRHQVSLPPALLISVQAIMGVLFGFLGAAVASPMLATFKKGVEEVYIRDVLERGQTMSDSQE